MRSATTTAAQEPYPPTGRPTGESGSAVSRALTRADPSRRPPQSQRATGSEIRSYEPSPIAWASDSALESDATPGLPYVPDQHVAAALPVVRAAIAETREALRRVSEAQALSLIGTLGMSRKSARMTDLDAQARVSAMIDEWRDIPADLLRDAVEAYRRSGDERDDWMPTGGRIRALALPAYNRRLMRLKRLKDWAEELEQRAARQAEMDRPLSPEQQAELDRLNARRKAALYEPSEDDPPPGITLDEWREMLSEARAVKSARDGLGRGYE